MQCHLLDTRFIFFLSGARGSLFMIHFSCDRCKRELDAVHDLRYEVRVEIEAMVDRDSELVDHTDHLSEIDELLENCDEFGCGDLGEEINQKHRFDLCSECYRQFVKNPLGREVSLPFGFSEN